MDPYVQRRGPGVGVRLHQQHEFAYVRIAFRPGDMVFVACDWRHAQFHEAQEIEGCHCPTELSVLRRVAWWRIGRGQERLSDGRSEVLSVSAPNVQLRDQEPGRHLRLRRG